MQASGQVALKQPKYTLDTWRMTIRCHMWPYNGCGLKLKPANTLAISITYKVALGLRYLNASQHRGSTTVTQCSIVVIPKTPIEAQVRQHVTPDRLDRAP